MTDEELVVAAARAAGLHFWKWEGPIGRCAPEDFKGWNPLHDDGDALRLAAALRLRISISDTHEYTEVVYYREFGFKRDYSGIVEQWGGNRYAATRRAIVRAAAAIGAAMRDGA
jgi:hypothetical protein